METEPVVLTLLGSGQKMHFPTLREALEWADKQWPCNTSTGTVPKDTVPLPAYIYRGQRRGELNPHDMVAMIRPAVRESDRVISDLQEKLRQTEVLLKHFQQQRSEFSSKIDELTRDLWSVRCHFATLLGEKPEAPTTAEDSIAHILTMGDQAIRALKKRDAAQDA